MGNEWGSAVLERSNADLDRGRATVRASADPGQVVAELDRVLVQRFTDVLEGVRALAHVLLARLLRAERAAQGVDFLAQ